MRRCMIVLAISGILSAPLTAAEDPFDFTSPLQSQSTRTAQYFSRSNEDADSTPSDVKQETDAAPFRRTSPSMPGNPLSEPAAPATAKYPQSVRFGQEMAREKAATSRAAAPKADAQPNPQETLRRFDEFLKTREVVSAEYQEPSGEQAPSAIQQVQMEDDLPSFGDLDGNAPAQAQKANENIRDLLFGNEPATEENAGEKLTDPISTFPADITTPEPLPAVTDDIAPMPQTHQSPSVEPSFEVSDFDSISTPANIVSTPASMSSINVNEVTPAETVGSPSAIHTQWRLLEPLNVGQQCRAELAVTNTGENIAERISLEVRLPESVQVIKTTPEPVEKQAFLGWKIPQLAGGETTTIQVVLMTSLSGSLDLATFVRHTSAQHQSLMATEPKLEIALSGPEKVNFGEPASQTLIVKNPGSGTATNVTIDAKIPAGLEHAQGGHLQMEVGSLNPGEVRSVRLVMSAVSGGNHIVQVEATADAGIVRTAAAEVTVIAPSLRAGIAGPSLRYLGREAEYTIRVLNDGSAPTDFVQVNHRIPEGFDFLRAERGAKYDKNTRILNWYVGRLESGQSLDLTLALLPTAAGEFVHTVRASSDLGAQSDAKITTRVQGAASLVVEVADLDDPVEVGSETAYEITITNEGTASANTVGLTCEIPQGLAMLKAEGPSEHRMQGEMIGFRPVTELAAGKSLKYRVFVKGGVAGDQRFRCRLTSESLKEPLFTEELTKFYGE